MMYLQECVSKETRYGCRKSDFSYKTGIGHGGVENVVNEDREELEESLVSGSRDRVRGMIGIGPCVSTTGETAIGKVIDNTLVRIFLRSHKHQTRHRQRSKHKSLMAVHTALGCEGNRYHRKLVACESRSVANEIKSVLSVPTTKYPLTRGAEAK